MRRGSGAAGPRGRRIAGQLLLPTCPAVLLLAVLACQPYTTRPSFGPLPTAAEAFVDQPSGAHHDDALRGIGRRYRSR